jgi:hypothetical protein
VSIIWDWFSQKKMKKFRLIGRRAGLGVRRWDWWSGVSSFVAARFGELFVREMPKSVAEAVIVKIKKHFSVAGIHRLIDIRQPSLFRSDTITCADVAIVFGCSMDIPHGICFAC